MRSPVAGFISSHDCHITFETGSGSSCSQGLLEWLPSPKRCEGCTRRVSWPSPAIEGRSKSTALLGRIIADTCSASPPWVRKPA